MGQASPPVSVLVGLGNPGSKHARQRHNVGFWLVDMLASGARVPFQQNNRFKCEAARIMLAGQELWLLKPATFMNRSGDCVQPFIAFYKLQPEQILVAHDDLDLPPGTIRLKRGGGHGGHNGLRDITRTIGPDFARLRIGIGHPGHKDQVLGHVLAPARAEEEDSIFEGLGRARRALDIMLGESWDKATQLLHTKPRQSDAIDG